MTSVKRINLSYIIHFGLLSVDLTIAVRERVGTSSKQFSRDDITDIDL